MASRRRKAPRKAKKGHAATLRGSAAEAINGAGHSPEGAGTLARRPAAVVKRRKPRFSTIPDADAGKFLSPEQQYLLRKRRDVEQREARQRRSAIAIVVAVIAAAAGAVWALRWL